MRSVQELARERTNTTTPGPSSRRRKLVASIALVTHGWVDASFVRLLKLVFLARMSFYPANPVAFYPQMNLTGSPPA